VTATAKRRVYGSAAIVDASALTSSGRIVKKAFAAISDVSTLGVGALAIRRAQVAVSSASDMAALALLTIRGHAAVVAESMLTADARVTFSVYFDEVDATFKPTLPNVDSYSNSGASRSLLPNAKSYAGVTAYDRRT
jgi:hypothetical protein